MLMCGTHVYTYTILLFMYVHNTLCDMCTVYVLHIKQYSVYVCMCGMCDFVYRMERSESHGLADNNIITLTTLSLTFLCV